MNKTHEMILLQNLQKNITHFDLDKLNLHYLIDLRVEVSKRILKLRRQSQLGENQE